MPRFLWQIMLLIGGFIAATNVLVMASGYDPSADIGMPWSTGLERLMHQLTLPTTLVFGLVLLIFAVGGYAFGGVDTGGSMDDLEASPIVKPVPIALKLSSEADAASHRVRTALSRLSKMPSGVMTPEVQIEYDTIRTRHVPDLEAAHTKARSAVDDDDAVEAVDTNYAVSLSLIANKLDGLLDDCEIAASRDLAIQHRFIETRHPPEDGGPL